MICHNICERIYSKRQVGQSHYLVGKKHCRRCGVYLYHKGVFCPCCGMQLRTAPIDKESKEKIRHTQNKNEVVKTT
jgi:uncharacterized Zn finger protein (UPF0148 family)